MIIPGTVLNVADNSGAHEVRCIQVLHKGTHCYTAHLTDIIRASVISADPKGKVKKGEVIKGVIVRTKSGINRTDGSAIRFSDNAFVILQENEADIVGTRIFGVVPRELKDVGFAKIVSLANEVI